MAHATSSNGVEGAVDPAPDAPDGADDLCNRATDRRTFMKGCMILAGSAAGMKYGSIEARAAIPLAPIGYAAGGAALGYLMGEASDYILGDDRDLSGYVGEEAMRLETQDKTLEMRSADERVMTSINNNLTTSENVALAKGKAAAITAMNDGRDQTVAEDDMQEVVYEYYTTIQKNIATHWKGQLDQLKHLAELFYGHEDLYEQDYWYLASNTNTQNSLGPQNFDEDGNLITEIITHTYVDGTTEDYEVWEVSAETVEGLHGTNPSWMLYGPDETEFGDDPHVDDHPDKLVFQEDEMRDAFNEADQKAIKVIDELAGFIADVYSHYDVGEIPTEDIVDPITASTELSQDYDGYQAQGAHAAMLGIPTTAEQSLFLTIHTDDGDVEVWADLYTEHVPNEGTEDEGFTTGNTYFPHDWESPTYIAYEREYEDEDGETVVETDFTQIETEFTVTEATDADGNSIESFQTESRNTQTAESDDLEEELDQIREAQLEMQEEAQSGGGAGFSIGGYDVPGWGVIAIVAGAIALVFGNGS